MKKYLFTLLLALCLSVSAFAEGNYIRGDVNGDGVVDPADLTALIDYLLEGNLEVNMYGADVSQDGTIAPDDISALIDYLLSGQWPGTEVYTVNGVSFTMVDVEGGTFMMGGDELDSESLPVHQVTLSSYAIGQTEVTQELWEAVMDYNPSQCKYFHLKRPVESVSWYDCQEFIVKLNELTGMNFRLPTEAEWEFAARGGNQSYGYKYAGSDDIDEVAWYKENMAESNLDTLYGTRVVGLMKPNELGIYDMSGNVREWCQDWYGAYSSDPQTDPTGPEEEPDYHPTRIFRGGNWFCDAFYCTVSVRGSYPATSRAQYAGLRLALSDINHLSALPVITTEVRDNTVTVTATGDGTVRLYVNDQEVDNPYTAIRGNESYTITAYATAKSDGKLMNQSKDQTITIPALNTETFTVNGVSFTMMPVEGGTFTMGATEEQGSDYESDELPVHQVTLSHYSIGQTEVTQELWEAVMGTNPSRFSSRWGYDTNLARPVEFVSWDECQNFITKLNQMTGEHFRLPSEAEWEFAARGGVNSKGYKYAGGNVLDDVAWCYNNSGDVTHTVATKAPNELGLYDMSGNVSEWCQDWYGEYISEPWTNPMGPETASDRVYRGGGWNDDSIYCRVSSRDYVMPGDRGLLIGFRLVLDENTYTVNGVSFTMVPVEGGTFMMGTTEDLYEAVGSEVHQVTLTGYSIGQTEVTQQLWEAVMGSNPSYFNGQTASGVNLQRPVEDVSWDDCQLFIAELNRLTGKNFRLPTEAEWEFAARGGNKSQGFTYAGSNNIDEVAWYDANSEWVNDDSPDYGTHPVSTKMPNELGLYDMSGNVFEWCQDWCDAYSSDAQIDPTGPALGITRIYRGGGWEQGAHYCKVPYRAYAQPSYRDYFIGLRLAL